MDGMSDSLLVEALSSCRAVLVDLPDTPATRSLDARVNLLERATLSLDLHPGSRDQIVRLAKAVLDLRDEVVRAREAG